MCGRPPEPTPQATPAPIQGRNPDLTEVSTLPAKKELTDPEDIADVEYGAGSGDRKKEARGAEKRQGTDALKINLQTPGGNVASTAGVANTGGTP